jgi:type II secretory pathway predicted ATPase ExeA
MHGNTIDFGFPSLSKDPFSSSPLDKDEFDLLVGRHTLFDELERKITFKSADRVLLVGEFGSGKTSFMQCLGSRTNLHINVDRISISEPGIELLKEMYAQLIDASPPNDYQKLSRDLQRMLHDSRQMLPLITVDAEMADFSSLEACLRSSLPFFERLPVLIVIAINPQQQSLISEQLLQRFEVRSMKSLDIDGVKALVERRIAKASTQPYEMATEDAHRLLQLSQSGQPGHLIRTLRNVVSGQFVSPRPVPPPVEPINPEPQSFDQVVPDQAETEDKVLNDDEVAEDQIEDEANLEEWEETPGMTQASGFDLDFGILDEPVEEPSVELPQEVEIEGVEQESDDSYVTEDSLPFVGVFGGLRNRRKIVNHDLDASLGVQFEPTEKGTAFWSGEKTNHADGETNIIEDEIDDLISEPDESIGYEVQPSDLQDIELPENPSLDSSTIETFTRLLAQVLQPTSGRLSGEANLIERLQALSRPKFTEKEEHILSVSVLSSLTASESIVVAEAKGRNISPSDKALLSRLSIKRARLSQICNRLHKAGILHARMVGRSRMFGLTRTALAQLIAWGIVGGDE